MWDLGLSELFSLIQFAFNFCLKSPQATSPKQLSSVFVKKRNQQISFWSGCWQIIKLIFFENRKMMNRKIFFRKRRTWGLYLLTFFWTFVFQSFTKVTNTSSKVSPLPPKVSWNGISKFWKNILFMKPWFSVIL